MHTTPTNQTLDPNQKQVDNEIDLRQIAGALLRRWPFIAGGGAIGLILSFIHLIPSKPVFQGEFQIVLDQQKTKKVPFLCSLQTLD